MSSIPVGGGGGGIPAGGGAPVGNEPNVRGPEGGGEVSGDVGQQGDVGLRQESGGVEGDSYQKKESGGGGKNATGLPTGDEGASTSADTETTYTGMPADLSMVDVASMKAVAEGIQAKVKSKSDEAAGYREQMGVARQARDGLNAQKDKLINERASVSNSDMDDDDKSSKLAGIDGQINKLDGAIKSLTDTITKYEGKIEKCGEEIDTIRDKGERDLNRMDREITRRNESQQKAAEKAGEKPTAGAAPKLDPAAKAAKDAIAGALGALGSPATPIADPIAQQNLQEQLIASGQAPNQRGSKAN